MGVGGGRRGETVRLSERELLAHINILELIAAILWGERIAILSYCQIKLMQDNMTEVSHKL